jgi:hypothetical protein
VELKVSKKKRRTDWTGYRHGAITAIRKVGTRRNSWGNVDAIWLCKCDCGNEIEITTRSLRKERKSCGCKKNETSRKRMLQLSGSLCRLPRGEASFNAVFAKYTRRAEMLKLDFNIDKHEFRTLVSSDCFYCGSKPSNVSKPNKYTNGEFLYNGLDRKDSAVGYETWNVVPCCSRCNLAKRDMNVDEFFKFIFSIAERHKEAKNEADTGDKGNE